MKLVNIHTLVLTEFGAEPPRYAILSHRWSDNEITYKDLVKGRNTENLGYEKVIRFAEYVKSNCAGVDWIWVDTCCIDKRSSAELSEAINSMYEWYRASELCVAYLADVPSREFSESEWFTRGWTLQELIAPEKDFNFCDQEWNLIGTRKILVEAISTITNIPSSMLLRKSSLNNYSLAQRLSWAAGRQTSRPEDRAYSLLGLFDLSLDTRYGEGEKAFRRLQEEIIRSSADMSIFAWEPSSPPSTTSSRLQASDLLATSPDDFAGAVDIVSFQKFPNWSLHTMNNIGLKITGLVLNGSGHPKLLLDCFHRGDPTAAILLNLFSVKPEHKNEKEGNLCMVYLYEHPLGHPLFTGPKRSRLSIVDADYAELLGQQQELTIAKLDFVFPEGIRSASVESPGSLLLLRMFDIGAESSQPRGDKYPHKHVWSFEDAAFRQSSAVAMRLQHSKGSVVMRVTIDTKNDKGCVEVIKDSQANLTEVQQSAPQSRDQGRSLPLVFSSRINFRLKIEATLCKEYFNGVNVYVLYVWGK